MTNKTPAQLADEAAENIRAINHKTIGGYEHPSEVYDVVGGLAHLVRMLPQVLQQAQGYLEKLNSTNELGHDSSEDADAEVTDVDSCVGAIQEATDGAVDALDILRQELDVLHVETGHLYHKDS